MKLIRCFAASLFSLTLFFLSCSGSGAAPSETTAAPDTTAAAPPLALVSGGTSDYIIVRAENADDAVVDAAIALVKAFDAAGVKVRITSDWEKRNADPADRPKHEILIGQTNREESGEVYRRLRTKDYAVEVVGEKLVLCGGSSAATSEACRWFAGEYLGEQITDLTLARGLLHSEAGRYAIDSMTIGRNPITDYKIVIAGDASRAAVTLQEAIAARSGYTLPIVEEQAFSGPAIVVGLPTDADIKRMGNGEQTAGLSGTTDHVMAQKDNMLFLAGANDWTATDAVNAFISTYLTAKTGEVTVDEINLRSAMTAAEPLHADADLRVMTFNIYGTNGDYQARFPYIRQTIHRYLPDLIGFQEANRINHEQVLAPMLDVYAHVAPYHSDGKTVNYTAILYRKDRLRVVESDVAFLRSRYTGTNTKSITWAVMEVIETGERFIITNLHGALIADSYNIPGSNSVEGAAWREDNIQEMGEKIDALRAKYGDLPTLSTGDFNFTSASKAYRDANALGLLSADVASTDMADMNISSTHKVGVLPGAGNAIDHIFVNDRVKVYRHKIISDIETLKGSDHCPVIADVSLAGQ